VGWANEVVGWAKVVGGWGVGWSHHQLAEEVAVRGGPAQEPVELGPALLPDKAGRLL